MGRRIRLSVRRRILFEQDWFTKRCFTEPEVVKKELIADVRAHLDPQHDVDTDFNPDYLPWRQRIAFVPDGDLFEGCLLYTSPSPRDRSLSRMPSSA